MAKGYKTGGRSKGTPNRLTSDLRSKIGDIIDVTMESLDIDTLSKLEKIKLLQVCLQYAIPKLQSQVIDLNTEERPQQVEITILDNKGNDVTEREKVMKETLESLDNTDLGLVQDLNKMFNA